MLPFTSEQFFELFANYNRATWPMAIFAYALALAVVVLLFRARALSSRVISGVLAFMWLWTGAAYHWLYFSRINSAAILFGAIFVVQGAVFIATGVARGYLRFRHTHNVHSWVGIAFIAYSAIIYPLVGLFTHGYPKIALFGVTPCPVTIFTFGCLLLLESEMKWWIVVLPFAWSLTGGTAAFLLQVPQDWPLLASGFIAVALRASARRQGVSAKTRLH
jgi:hypothetical protein